MQNGIVSGYVQLKHDTEVIFSAKWPGTIEFSITGLNQAGCPVAVTPVIEHVQYAIISRGFELEYGTRIIGAAQGSNAVEIAVLALN